MNTGLGASSECVSNPRRRYLYAKGAHQKPVRSGLVEKTEDYRFPACVFGREILWMMNHYYGSQTDKVAFGGIAAKDRFYDESETHRTSSG
jgi:hypothetical protein